MAGKSRSWTPERRAAQAERMRTQKPWLKTTGPKTDAGKQRVAKNSQTHGRRSAEFMQQVKILRTLLRTQRAQLKNLSPVIPKILPPVIPAQAGIRMPAQDGHDNNKNRKLSQ